LPRIAGNEISGRPIPVDPHKRSEVKNGTI
jgi:hypothetical protein